MLSGMLQKGLSARITNYVKTVLQAALNDIADTDLIFTNAAVKSRGEAPDRTALSRGGDHLPQACPGTPALCPAPFRDCHGSLSVRDTGTALGGHQFPVVHPYGQEHFLMSGQRVRPVAIGDRQEPTPHHARRPPATT